MMVTLEFCQDYAARFMLNLKQEPNGYIKYPMMFFVKSAKFD